MTRQIRVIIDKLRRHTENAVKRITLSVTANLMETTPIDTGWARANWVPRIGSEWSNKVGSRESIDKTAQQMGIATVATGYTLNQGPVFVSNNVPYIQALNEGHSKQAPSGFVQLAIAQAVRETGG